VYGDRLAAASTGYAKVKQEAVQCKVLFFLHSLEVQSIRTFCKTGQTWTESGRGSMLGVRAETHTTLVGWAQQATKNKKSAATDQGDGDTG
jgi:hypothetical protein